MIDHVPEGDYGLQADGKVANWGTYTYPATVVAGSELALGDVYLCGRGMGNNVIAGVIELNSNEYPGRDLLLTVSDTLLADSNISSTAPQDVTFWHILPEDIASGRPLDFEIGGYWEGEYVVRLLSVGVNDTDEIVLAEGAEPVLIEDPWAGQRFEIGTLVAAD